VCPDCWEPLQAGEPGRRDSLSLLYRTTALYEADLLQAALADEGIPCLRVGSPLDPPVGPNSRVMRVYVRADTLVAARELLASLLGPHAEADR
jgi:hypothetical protein